MGGDERGSFVEALSCAIREVRPAAERASAEAVAALLGEHVTRSWGADHGMSDEELLATARDLKSTFNAGDQRDFPA